MLDRVRDFLIDNTTPEHLAVLTDSDDILVEFGGKHFDDSFIDTLERLNSQVIDTNTAVQEIDFFYREFLFTIIRDHYIGLEDDSLPVSDLNILLRAIKQCQELEQAQLIVDIINSDEDDIGKFCSILALTCVFDKEWFLVRINYVHPNTLYLLEDLYKTKATLESVEETVESTIVKSKLALIKDFLLYLKIDDLNITRFIRSGMAVNLPIKDYIIALNDYFLILPEESLVKELYACAILSEETEPRLNLLSPVINRYVDNSDQVSRMRTQLRKTEVDFLNFLKEKETFKNEPYRNQ
ncbi:MAG: hypothetical protein M0R77_00985 [Gammaproteobacteria bacterium]|nr:hypothetical protein [Acholeplasmataceae bacterium]MCK9529130.1 hypothetical protein [Gammaproteobacteria bacterium]